jgi:hypothetical protein
MFVSPVFPVGKRIHGHTTATTEILSVERRAGRLMGLRLGVCGLPPIEGAHSANVYAQAGDVIGCGIDFNQQCIFFSKNGIFLGKPSIAPCRGYISLNWIRTEGMLPKIAQFDRDRFGPLFPVVGLRTPGEAIRVNFGQEPFQFDVDAHFAQRAANTEGGEESGLALSG